MPVAASARPQVVTYTLRDNNNKTASMSFNMPAGWEATAAVSLAFLDALTDAIILATDCRVQSVTVARELQVLGNRFAVDAIPATAEVERKLVMTFETDLENTVTISLPSPVFDMETDNTDNVDPSNPLLAPIIDAIVDGPLGPLNGPVNSSLRPVATFREAFITHRNRARKV